MEVWWIVALGAVAFLIRLIVFLRSEARTDRQSEYIRKTVVLLRRADALRERAPLWHQGIATTPQAVTIRVEILHIESELRSMPIPEGAEDYGNAIEQFIAGVRSELDFKLSSPHWSESHDAHLKELKVDTNAGGNAVQDVIARMRAKNVTGIRGTVMYAFLFGVR